MRTQQEEERRTRARTPLRWAGTAACLAVMACGCAAEAPAPSVPAAPPRLVTPAPEPPAAPVEYVLAEVDPGSSGFSLPLDPWGGSIGTIVDGIRLISSSGTHSLAPEVTDPPLAGVDPLPQRLGGGFLFRSRRALYRSDTFQGRLLPLVTLDVDIRRISFGPKAILVRGASGMRWLVHPSTGERVPIAPPGLVEVVTTSTGRAAAIAEFGRALVSTDLGATWLDMTERLAAPAQKVLARGADLWVVDAAGRAYQSDPSGAWKEFDRLAADTGVAAKLSTPSWRGDVPPLRAVMRMGARWDSRSAVVVAAGDIYRIDIRSGAVLSVIAGRLPPDLPCEAARTLHDIVIVCAAPRRVGVVASLPLSGDAPQLERTFPLEAPFFMGDDGALVFGDACAGGKKAAIACVRDRPGQWSEFHAESAGPAPDGGIAPADLPLRWIPRSDGPPVVIVRGAPPAIVARASGREISWRLKDLPEQTQANVTHMLAPTRPGDGGRVLDRRFSLTPEGTIRGWLNRGQSFEVKGDGTIALSSFIFDVAVNNGWFALGRTSPGRAWQSVDRGASWVEVAAPPVGSSSASFQPRACTDAGCDLGPWLRVGWNATPPVERPQPVAVASPAALGRPKLPEIACEPAGALRRSVLAPTVVSPDDFGLGASRVPISQEVENGPTFIHTVDVFCRDLVNPARGLGRGTEGPIRAISHGFSLQFDDAGHSADAFAGITVLGPNRDARTAKKHFTFIEPFDPAGALRSPSYDLSAVIRLTRAMGIALAQSVSNWPDMSDPVVILSEDAAAGELLVSMSAGDTQLLGVATGGKKAAVKLNWAKPYEGEVVSAVGLGAGELAVLSVDGDGKGYVLRLGAGGVTRLGEVPAPPSPDHYPTNPDALALGPSGALSILRTPSGSEPPSAADPAWLLPMSGSGATRLAPWSTLTRADDPACRSDPQAVRAVIQTHSPWVQLRHGGPAAASNRAMWARVRWSAARVCLEAIELLDKETVPARGEAVAPVVAVRFGTTPNAGRTAIGLGFEERQPLMCVLVPE